MVTTEETLEMTRKAMKDQYEDMTAEYNFLKEKYQKLEEDYDYLYKKYINAIYNVKVVVK